MTHCDFNNHQKTCPVCGYVAKKLPTYRVCRPVQKRQPRLFAVGDAVERWLTKAGVTKARVERWTRTAGKPGGCGCEARKKWLNDVGYRVQRSAIAAASAAAKWYGVS